METREHFYIDGGYVAPAGTGTIDVISPHTEQVIARVPDGTNADIDRAVAAARKAFDDGEWTRTTPAERSAKIAALSAAINARMDEAAKLISSENGSPYSFSIMGQVLSSTMVLDYYAGLAQTFPFEELRPGLMGPTLVRKEPVGVVAAIVPVERPAVHRDAEDRARLWRPAARSSSSRRPRRRSTATCSRSASTRPASRPASSTSSPPAARSASTSSRTPTSTRSPSPARPPRASASARSPASGSVASRSSSAASRRRSSSTTPTSRPPSRRCSARAS